MLPIKKFRAHHLYLPLWEKRNYVAETKVASPSDHRNRRSRTLLEEPQQLLNNLLRGGGEVCIPGVEISKDRIGSEQQANRLRRGQGCACGLLTFYLF